MTTFDIKECAEYLRIHPESLRRMSRENKVPHFKVGGKYLFRKQTLDDWIEKQEEQHESINKCKNK